ncbi:uncharacterized protein PV09_08859 [Verruconis gallopava]|uniref:Serine/threonine-protein kinase Tel1 n=1 Tax=Verruconis gallopava TaxID=253628 RepID=A0A0D1ZY89_9PEZI|nr:uncharacterized protein PV09_08859 [Verruconis gallopava]KIV99427.1 hypothetical protein PV09_08859 [Verruconis gallopava]
MSGKYVDLDTTLTKIASSSSTVRKDGLADLEHLFRYNKDNHVIDDFKDKTWHSIYEALFTCTAVERSSFLRTSQSQRNRAAARLAACGKALRITVTAGVKRIRAKTVKAVVDHVLQTLPTKEGPYCPGLALDYVKTLRVILEYQPHVEHFRDLWQQILDFCLEGLSPLREEDDEEKGDVLETAGASMRMHSITLSRRSRATTPQLLRPRQTSAFRAEIDDLVACMYQLVRATNAQVVGNELRIFHALQTFLKSSDSVRLSYTDAFAAINAILARIVTGSTGLTRSIAIHLVPLVKELWTSKSSTLRDEMLTSLVLTKDHVLALTEDPAEILFRSDLENLVETLQLDYSKRRESDQLQLSDLVLDLSLSPMGMSNLRLPAFGLRRGHLRAESTWTILHLIAAYTSALDNRQIAVNIDPAPDDDIYEGAKRPRITLLFDDMLRSASSSVTGNQISNLQYMCFRAQISQLTKNQIVETLSALCGLMNHSSPHVTQWAILSHVCVAFQLSAQDISIREQWYNVFLLAARLLTVDWCSRPASYLLFVLLRLHLLRYGDIASIADSILESVDLQGPTSACDATLALLGLLMDERAAENPSTALSTAQRLVQWLIQKWSPGNFDNKEVSARYANTCRPYDLVIFLTRCLGSEVFFKRSIFPLCGPTAQAWRKLEETAELRGFLLLLNSAKFLYQPEDPIINGSVPGAHLPSALVAQIIDALDGETARVLGNWIEIAADKPLSFLPDMFIVVAGVITVNASIIQCVDRRSFKRIEALRKREEELIKAFFAMLARPECDMDKLDAVFNALADYLPNFEKLNDNTGVNGVSADNPFVSLCVHLASALDRRQRTKTEAVVAEDGMDIDIGFESQSSDAAALLVSENAFRDVGRASSSLSSFGHCVNAQAHLFTAVLRDSVELPTTAGNVSIVPNSFVSYLIELSPNEFFASRIVISEVLSTGATLRTGEIEALLEHLGLFLETYEYARHEIALLLHVELLHRTIADWTNGENNYITESASQAYEWLINVALPNNICSSHVKVSIASLLLQLFKAKGPNYETSPEIASVRTALFRLLQSDDLLVIERVIRGVPDLFHQFTLERHEDVFNDLHSSSLYSETWIEGNALRMLLFSSLGSRWHTLLRRCIYHIFETAGAIPATAPYASRCIQEMAVQLRLTEPQALFRLFAGQLMYTWTRQSEGGWSNIPFGIFGYDSLRSLLFDVRDEVYAQALLRNDTNELVETSRMIGIGQNELAKYGFARSAVYCYAWDAEKRRPEKEKSETRLRGLLGSNYTAECRAHFPKAFGILILRTNFEKKTRSNSNDQQKAQNFSNDSVREIDKEIAELMFERAIGSATAANREAKFEANALKAFKAMTELSSSDMCLPDPQQPVFRPKHFLEVADRMARRAKTTLASALDPAVYVFVLRLLLSQVHDALGSLYSCLIVRKIRILVALAGQSALSGYPLEATLFSLRPLLTDKLCAEDALGIVQYLYTNGINYLRQEISFVAGMNVTALISLRKFLGSSQESTTQESHHRATLNRAHAFRKWLVEIWSKKFVEDMADSEHKNAYLRMISYAYGAGIKANPVNGSPESNLLRQLLEDRRAKHRLLQGATWGLALNLLCSDFDEPPSYREDMLGRDEDAKNYATDIWSSCLEVDVNERYLQWAGRILGRANSNDDFDGSILTHIHNHSMPDYNDDEKGESSLKVIIDTIQNLLLSGDCLQTGLAEETLRSILVHADTQQLVLELQELLPQSVAYGLALQTEDVVVPITIPATVPLETCFISENIPAYDVWLRQVTRSLVASSNSMSIVRSLDRILAGVNGLAEKLFAPVLHLVLSQELSSTGSARQCLSKAYREWLSRPPRNSEPHIRVLLNSLLYLRKQPYPQELTNADRLKWLDVDYSTASTAAEMCGMYTAALMFAELTSVSELVKGSRRSTTTLNHSAVSEETMLDIYRNIDDPDSFYGVPQPPSLDLVLHRLDHEADGFKGLMFRAARLDSQMRRNNELSKTDNVAIVKSLVGMNMNTLTYNLLSSRNSAFKASGTLDSFLQTAMRLEQWDVRVPENASSDTVTLYKIFQTVNIAKDITTVREQINAGITRTILNMKAPTTVDRTFKSSLSTLGILTDIDGMITSTSPEELHDICGLLHEREASLSSVSIAEAESVLSSRDIFLSTVCSNASLRDAMHVSIECVRKSQVDAILSSCRVWKKRHGSQEYLDAVTYLSDLVPICAEVGIDIRNSSDNAAADALWTQGEYSTSVRMLQRIIDGSKPKNESNDVHPAAVLAKIGHHAAEARLETPHQIFQNYLMPAINELRGNNTGPVASQVFHELATFCYEQLQNQENIDDIERATKVRNRRQIEVDGLTSEIKAIRSQAERRARESELSRARRWLRLDKAELERLRKIRESFVEQCIENYLRSLTASDEHDNNVLRFYAIWLEHADSELANSTVNAHIDHVSSHKFVRLMNQLSSRLQADNTLFQKVLSKLVFRISSEHPFHGMHHISAGSHDPGTDQVASISRHNAVKQIAGKLKADKVVGKLWDCMYQSDILYHEVAIYTDDEVARQGRELRLDAKDPTKRLLTHIPRLQTPPPTLSIPVSAKLEYKAVPRVIGFRTMMRVAGGLSAPKIITSKLSDGTEFKQLFKGGNDDLRQDAIMEQVFEEVSKLLRNHSSTRQRRLRVRTYNVLPLSNHSGVLEFCANTTALQDALIPLHQTYHPKDLKSSVCRSKISDAARNTTEERIKAYRDVCKQFHPVMRHFFFERFPDPDVWFEKRLAYTRSMAAMSILGYVIGLGDRHLHNILLDYFTGEVIHIDLGVCFEAGRVLPIPEVVPFRLTRDLVDGMGYTRTEGVYRRCCEFTLEALREERESIMTLLNVLRYDPLYSWTVSATKAKRIQETEDVPNRAVDEANMMEASLRKKDDDMGEAGRALSVVEKKLSKTLSKEATVSELIAQATDERNLALLFAGWSAWV